MRDRLIQGMLVRSLLVVVLCLFFAGAVQAAKVQVPAGTEVKVKFDSRAAVNSGDAVAGVPILIELAEPITIGGKIIVEEGAKGTAVVSEVKKAGKGGKPGNIKVEFVDLEPKGLFKAPEGAKIKLAGTAEGKGKGKKTLSYLFIFGLFIKGTQGELSTTQAYPATVADNIILESQ